MLCREIDRAKLRIRLNCAGRTLKVDIQPMVADFYAAMGWDEEGRPTEETLARLGIERQEPGG